MRLSIIPLLVIISIIFCSNSFAQQKFNPNVTIQSTKIVQVVVNIDGEIMANLSDAKGALNGFWRLPFVGEFTGVTEETRKYMFSLLMTLYTTGKSASINGQMVQGGRFIIGYLHALDTN